MGVVYYEVDIEMGHQSTLSMPERQAGIFEADVGLNLITLGSNQIALILQ